MFDLANIEKVILVVLSHPAMAEITSIVGIAVSVALGRNKYLLPVDRYLRHEFLKKKHTMIKEC
jgi:hypothetical protein